MYPISSKLLVAEKMDRIMRGYSAYCESSEMKRLLKREITKHNLSVCEHSTEFGSWFIPEMEEMYDEHYAEQRH
ncbi:hypothetical protein EJF36_07745 [Bacillus sp. HMF5848]|uniref:hypothetical protein n=1 Tax=Bacillus sp. HMF5848 TaxID=2495421 RepID=UPI000F78DF04|nr:hypothetical protein [Bacillus sp. HMF5848]RSK26761.1 hypothetical protein EJF36_07745 [Bacillus sp. HMF5848]